MGPRRDTMSPLLDTMGPLRDTMGPVLDFAGPLRVKYDSVKYVVRRMEDTVFELSLQEGVEVPVGATPAAEGVAVDASTLVVDGAEFEVMRAEMEAYDAQREDVIKQCRDMQKAAKTSIYQLHRGNLDQAKAQLDSVLAQVTEMMPTINANKGLRAGSFSAVLEEYAEGLLFYRFLKDGLVLPMEDLQPCNAQEYLGGVLDLTGEVCRWAVAQATKRETAKVEQAREMVEAVLGSTTSLSGLPGNVYKKLNGVEATLKKLDTIAYELSLTRKSGAATADAPEPAANAE
ncbi:Translin [Baffinella frigidus]|nr:Translin [Cryptophyta sp. CCMP2293]